MKLDIKALAITAGVIAAMVFLFVGGGNLIWESYGVAALQLAASVYPGYDGPGGVVSVIVLTVWGFVDGVIWGAISAWLYNMVAGRSTAPIA